MYTIPLGKLEISEEQKEAIGQILESGRLTEGEWTKKLEEEVAKYIGTKYAVACSSGTTGLMMALQALKYIYKFRNEKPNVLIPALTFPATANALLITGYNVVLCDVGNSDTISPDPTIYITDEIIEKNDIEIIVPVHLFGYPCDMSNIIRLKEKYGLIVIEDACESYGSVYNVHKVGSLGDMGVFSFYASHAMGIGELGIVTTNSNELNKVLRSIKNHGRTGNNLEFKHNYIGGNYKTTEFMAALAYCKLKDADAIIKKRYENMANLMMYTNNSKLQFLWASQNVSYLGCPILAKDKSYKKYIIKKLQEAGIETREMFPCLKNQEALKGIIKGDFPVADDFEERGFYVSIRESLTEEELLLMRRMMDESISNM